MTDTLFDTDAHGAPIGLDEPGQARHDGPDTSKAAAANVRAGSQMLRLLSLVASAGPSGMTADDAQPAMSEGRTSPMSTNQVASRMGELRAKHLVVYATGADGAAVLRRTRTGNEAHVHVATEAGLSELVRHGALHQRQVAPSRAPLTYRPDVAAWLRGRAEAKADHEWPRRWGISSDALVAYALGTGDRPCTPGVPLPSPPAVGHAYAPDERGSNYPADKADLLACILTYESAPADLREVMAPVIAEFRAWVLEGRNRYGARTRVRP